MAFYPFPRLQTQPAPAICCAPIVGSPPIPPTSSPNTNVSRPSSGSQLPQSSWQQTAEEELDSDLVRLLAGTNPRRAERKAARSSRAAATSADRKATDIVIPAQEAAASMAVQQHQQQARARQERLYGVVHAAEVRTLEAILNRNFDRAVRAQPSPRWPSVALRAL